jgi:hypothetical protein
MKKLSLALSLAFVASAFADVPALINYQGRLVDGVGNPIVADDFTVWKSRRVSNSKDAQDFSVSVKGIKALELRVTCSGSASQTWPVWLNPVLLK